MAVKPLPIYNKSHLALRNGQDRAEVWIAYKGVIYDVSRSNLGIKEYIMIIGQARILPTS